MSKLLLRILLKDGQSVSDPSVREKCGQIASLVGIATNFILFLIKILVGTIFRSIAITADAVNNLSDSASSVVTLVGFKLSGKPADEEHPYGHARMEYISGLIVSFLILFLGIQLIQSSAEKIFHPEQAQFSVVTVAVLIISILGKVWQGLFYRGMGRTIGSTALEATAADSFNDVFSTSAILLGTVITKLTGFNLDGYMGVVVAVLIIITGINLIKETTNPLLGMAPDKKLVDDIYKKILSYDGIIGLHDLMVHNYGPGRCFASVHCEVPASQDIMVSHDIIDTVEHDFKREMGIQMVIHLDPVDTDNEQTNRLREQVIALLKEISPEIRMHDFRVVWGQTHSNLIFDVLVPFKFKLRDKDLSDYITKKISDLDSSYCAVITIDHSYVPPEQGGSN